MKSIRSNLRIIAYSADTQESTRLAVLRAGALGYIVRPLLVAKLQDIIPKVLASARHTRAAAVSNPDGAGASSRRFRNVIEDGLSIVSA